MNYKRICITLAMIIVVCVALVGIFNIKREYEHTKKIESILDFSDQEKSSLNYQDLIRDIKSLENGKGIKYAKNSSEDDNPNKGGNVKITVESKEYQGDGYKIDIYKAGETSIYSIYKDDECIYSVSSDMQKEQNKIKVTSIIYIIIILCAILEFIFLFKCKFGKSQSVQNDSSVESENKKGENLEKNVDDNKIGD